MYERLPIRHFWAKKCPDETLDTLFLCDEFSNTMFSQPFVFHPLVPCSFCVERWIVMGPAARDVARMLHFDCE